MFNCYVQQRVRRVVAEKGVPIWRAVEFLKETKYGVVSDSSRDYTLEELEYAENFGSPYRVGSDYTFRSDEKVYESTDRELPVATGDNSE